MENGGDAEAELAAVSRLHGGGKGLGGWTQLVSLAGVTGHGDKALRTCGR